MTHFTNEWRTHSSMQSNMNGDDFGHQASLPLKFGSLVMAALLTACASNFQGGVGPLASPKAAQIVDLTDELWRRAARLTSPPESQDKECDQSKRKLELTGGSFTDDVNRNESRLWKSSAIPDTAPLETRCLNKAHAAFENALALKAEDVKKAERNSLQDRLITASDQSCGLFKRYLNANQSSSNFLFGSSSLVLAAAATNVTSAVAAKNYATGALIGSGVSAQFNADMFNSQVAFAIAKAIDTSRGMELEKLQKERKDKNYSDYGISAAISDALRYHELCSLMSGLAAMDKSMTVMLDPGLKQMEKWFPNGELVTKGGTVIKINSDANKAVADAKQEIALQERLMRAQTFDSRAVAMIDEGAKHAQTNFKNQELQTKSDPPLKEQDVYASFKTQFEVFYGNKLRDKAKACVVKLDKVSQDLGGAVFLSNTKPKDISANQGLNKARADAVAAVARVEYYEDKLQRLINDTLNTWSGQWKELKSVNDLKVGPFKDPEDQCISEKS